VTELAKSFVMHTLHCLSMERVCCCTSMERDQYQCLLLYSHYGVLTSSQHTPCFLAVCSMGTVSLIITSHYHYITLPLGWSSLHTDPLSTALFLWASLLVSMWTYSPYPSSWGFSTHYSLFGCHCEWPSLLLITVSKKTDSLQVKFCL
jgi:hypothetical protein